MSRATGLRALAVAVATGAAVLTSGCVAERVTGVKLTAARATAAAAAPAACRFNVVSIEDLREQKSLGAMGRTQVGGEGFAAWFANGVAAIPGYSREPAPIALHIDVLKAYIQGLSTLKAANLVVRVEFGASSGSDKTAPVATRVYRGVDNSMNWANTENEIQGAFDNALLDLTQQIGADVGQRCNSSAPRAA